MRFGAVHSTNENLALNATLESLPRCHSVTVSTMQKDTHFARTTFCSVFVQAAAAAAYASSKTTRIDTVNARPMPRLRAQTLALYPVELLLPS